MSTYYILATDHIEIDIACQNLSNAYRASRSRFGPVFNDDRSEILVQVKPRMSTDLTNMLRQMTVKIDSDVDRLAEQNFEGDQPPDEDVTELVEGRKPMADIVPARTLRR